MSETTNQVTELSAISRLAKFNNVTVAKDSWYSILSVQTNSLYKVYISSGEIFIIVEIINKGIISLYSNTDYIDVVLNNNTLLVKGFDTTTANVTIDYFDVFEFSNKIYNETIKEYHTTQKDTTQRFQATVIDSAFINHAEFSQLELDKLQIDSHIKFGNWYFNINEDGNQISLTYGKPEEKEKVVEDAE